MPSKQVTDRQKSANAVIAAGETHSDRVGGELDGLLSPYLGKGEKVPDTALLIHLISRALGDARDAMVASDEAHLAELADDAAPREGRDEAAGALYSEITDLREWLVGLYGLAAAKRLGFSDITPRDPVALERFASEIVGALRTQTLPKPRRAGVTWDAAESVKKLDGLRASLAKHLKDVAREAREAEATLIAKTAAMAGYDERFSRVATSLVGIFQLAGHVDLADRVRPSTRRPGQTEEAAPPAEGTPPAEAGGAQPTGG